MQTIRWIGERANESDEPMIECSNCQCVHFMSFFYGFIVVILSTLMHILRKEFNLCQWSSIVEVVRSILNDKKKQQHDLESHDDSSHNL